MFHEKSEFLIIFFNLINFIYHPNHRRIFLLAFKGYFLNIIILSTRNKNLYSTSRLYNTAKKWGHDVTVIDYMRCYITIDSKRKGVFFNGKLIEKVDAIVPRIGASNTLYGTSIVRQFELLGTYCLNSASSITNHETS